MMRIISLIVPWAIVGFIIIPPWVKSIEPAENWFSVSGITVNDADAGSTIFMNVNRVIARPFVGTWIATVRKIEGQGSSFACTATGTSAYRTDAVYPRPLTLDWWTYPVKCDLAPGRYRLDTVWQFDVADNVTKTVAAESNVFLIR